MLDPAQPLAGANVNAAMLAVLARPYPQAIAGTPTRWSFVAATSAFTVVYSTTSPAGVTLAPGALTVVFLPAVQYPNGYAVTVTGGAVVSGGGTQSVSVAANAGATSVTITVARN